MSPKETYYDSFPRRGIVGAFNQYSASDRNTFVQNYACQTRARIWDWPHVFYDLRVEFRKQRLLMNFKKREVPAETFMGKVMTSSIFNWANSKRFLMNTECLATLFHVPIDMVVTQPHMPKVQSRKAGPPAGIAIFGSEKDIEKFL